jgi:agmatinase
LPPLVNVGQRDLLLTADHVGHSFRKTFSAAELAADPDAVLAYLRSTCAGARRVFVDLDCDVFDPAFFPAVSRPVPFGLSPQQVLRVLDAVWSDNLAGVLFSEFDPGRDVNDSCLATLLWLIEYVLLRRYES